MTTSLPDHIARPEFAVAVRGYDRTQVDDYLARMLEWLSDAESRASSAEEDRRLLNEEVTRLRRSVATLEERVGAPAPESMREFGERVGALMQEAMDAAEKLRTDADLESRERRQAAEAERDRILDQARSEAEDVVAEALERQRLIEERIEGLTARRQAAIDELSRINGSLAQFLSAPDRTPTDERYEPDDLPGPVGVSGAETPSPDETTVIPVVAGTPIADGSPASDDDVAETTAPTMVQPAVGRTTDGAGPASRST